MTVDTADAVTPSVVDGEIIEDSLTVRAQIWVINGTVGAVVQCKLILATNAAVIASICIEKRGCFVVVARTWVGATSARFEVTRFIIKVCSRIVVACCLVGASVDDTSA